MRAGGLTWMHAPRWCAYVDVDVCAHAYMDVHVCVRAWNCVGVRGCGRGRGTGRGRGDLEEDARPPISLPSTLPPHVPLPAHAFNILLCRTWHGMPTVTAKAAGSANELHERQQCLLPHCCAPAMATAAHPCGQASPYAFVGLSGRTTPWNEQRASKARFARGLIFVPPHMDI